MPVVETFDVNGKKSATIKSFAAFFLVTRPGKGGQNTVAKGQFIEYVAPGEHGPNPPPETKIYGIRLVE